ncbi:HEAT repeat domain-containing protein [Lusitaniella coriacea]|uniref:HEAT repeat domain-containing protein n=1 Tax=Lusitaniella coriacea TaxID=1983105 RepID=UPI003CF4846C
MKYSRTLKRSISKWLFRLFALLLTLLFAIDYGQAQIVSPHPVKSWQIQGISTALDDPNPRIQAEALEKAVEYDLNESEFLKIIPESRIAQIAVLLDSESNEVREVAIKVIGQMGEVATEQAPKLVELLEARNSLIRKLAAEALGRIGDGAKAQIPKLLELMQDRSPGREVSNVAAVALGSMGDAAKAQIPKLLELLQDQEGNARSEALATLERMRETAKSSAPAIAALLKDPTLNSRLKLKIVYLLVQWGKATPEDAFRLIEPLGSGSNDTQIAAAKALGQMGETAKGVVPKLVELLQDPESDFNLRWGIAMALRQMGKVAQEQIPQIVTLLKHPNPDIREAAERILRKMGEIAKEQIPQIVALLKHPNPDIRGAAARVLGNMGETVKEQLPQLVKLLQDPNPEVRKSAVYALGQMGVAAAEAIPQLVQSLGNPVFYAEQWAIINSLGAIGQAIGEYPPELIELLDNPNSLLRSRAVLALGRMEEAAKDAVLKMSELLEDNDPKVRRATLQGLRFMGKSAQNAAPKIAKLLDDPDSAPTELPENWPDYESQKSIRELAIEVLRDMGEGAKAQIPQLVKLLEDPEVGSIAALALARIGMPAKDYAPQIVAFVSKQPAGTLLSPDNDLSRRRSVVLDLEKMGPLDKEIALALLNAIYVPPPFDFSSRFKYTLERKNSFFAKVRFYAYYLCSTDPDAVTLIQWLGQPQEYPSISNREEGIQILQAFANSWESSEPFPEVRQDLAVQTAKVVSQGEWQIDDLPLLRTHYNHLKQGDFKPQAETLREALDRFGAWRKFKYRLFQLFGLSYPQIHLTLNSLCSEQI